MNLNADIVFDNLPPEMNARMAGPKVLDLALRRPELYEGGDAAVEDGKVIPVEPVYPSTVFETTLTEASASLKAGTAYTISADGASITTTTADGVAEVVNFDGKAVGDKVRVRFA